MHRVERIHQLEVEVRGGGVTCVADATQHIAGSHGLARLDRNRAGRQMGERRKYVATAHDHVIAEDRRADVSG